MNRIKQTLAAIALTFMAQTALAQDGEGSYAFLSVPVSAHSAALGGDNISAIEDDASLMFSNAALLSNVADRTISLGYTSYMSSSSLLSASYVKAHRERGTWAVGAQVLNYGSETMTDEVGNEMGDFTMRDINVQGSYAYLLTDRWTGAVTAKAIVSHYGDYSSTAIGADLALNYFDDLSGLSFSAVGRNFGGQVDPLFDERQSLPFDLALGISKEMANAPFRLSLTADDLTHWSDTNLMDHIIVGVDIFPSNNVWIAAGYNCLRAKQMKVADKSHGGGLSIGAGLNTKRVKIGATYAKYHVASSSLVINLAFNL